MPILISAPCAAFHFRLGLGKNYSAAASATSLQRQMAQKRWCRPRTSVSRGFRLPTHTDLIVSPLGFQIDRLRPSHPRWSVPGDECQAASFHGRGSSQQLRTTASATNPTLLHISARRSATDAGDDLALCVPRSVARCGLRLDQKLAQRGE